MQEPPSGAVISVGLFPLEGMVLFPRLPLPLHIFEPRYRALFREALAGDRRIAMAVPDPDAAPLPSGLPTLRPVATLARIGPAEKSPDGRYHVVLAGEARLRILEETGVDDPFRRARAEILEETLPPGGNVEAAAARARLATAASLLSPGVAEGEADGDVPLEVLVATVAQRAGLSADQRYALLEEGDVLRRALRTLALLEPVRPRLDRARGLRALYRRGWEKRFEDN